jgi:hypothetical protein
MDALQLFKQFQLGKSLFRGQWKNTKENLAEQNIPEEQQNEIILNEITIQLSKKILKDNSTAITKKEDGEFIEYNIELVILKKTEFKDVVEAVIQSLTYEQIHLIKTAAK